MPRPPLAVGYRAGGAWRARVVAGSDFSWEEPQPASATSKPAQEMVSNFAKREKRRFMD
jgi:hypothetical protein